MPEVRADPVATIAALDGRLATLEPGRRRRNLETFRERLATEMVGDVDGVMRTLSPRFHVEFRGPAGVQEIPAGPAIRETFEALCGDGDTTIWVDWTHLAVDEDVIIGEGTINMELPGRAARVLEYPVDDPDARYAVASHAVVTIVFDDEGLMLKEIVHQDPASAQLTRVAEGDRLRNDELAARLR